MKMGDLNKNYNNPTSYYPYQIAHSIDLDSTLFNNLFKKENMVKQNKKK